ncbi:MAG: hypothetical protein ACREQ9_19525 [Candidatus Binatia bacterium]
MLTRADDYPIHQTPEPIAYAGTDRNFYDRYFFNGHGREGEHFFAAALGVYPHLNVIDAAYCVVHEGIQHNVRASRCLHMERMDTRVGPIAVEVVEPLRRLRVRVEDPKNGIRADVRFASRARPIEEPRFQHRIGPRTFFDYTRLTQHGAYEGWIEVNGSRLELRPDRFLGVRDRSWGVRPVGLADPQPPAPPSMPQFYWLWAPLHFDDSAFLYDVCEDARGSAWHRSAIVAAAGDAEPENAAWADSSVVFRSLTRHAKSAMIRFRRRSGAEVEIAIEPKAQFYMAGLGYMNPEWGHGVFKGEEVAGYDTYDLGRVDESAPLHLHVQAFSKATLREGGRRQDGVGVLEQLVIGPHEPSGFREVLDLAP